MKTQFKGVYATRHTNRKGDTQYLASVCVKGKQYNLHGYVARDLAAQRDSVLHHVLGEQRPYKYNFTYPPEGPLLYPWARDLQAKLGAPQPVQASAPPASTAPLPERHARLEAAFSAILSSEAILRAAFPELAARFPACQPPSPDRGEAAGSSAIPTPPFSSNTP